MALTPFRGAWRAGSFFPSTSLRKPSQVGKFLFRHLEPMNQL
jgi:hypothetical protein